MKSLIQFFVWMTRRYQADAEALELEADTTKAAYREDTAVEFLGALIAMWSFT